MTATQETGYAYEFCRFYTHECEVQDQPAPYALALTFLENQMRFAGASVSTVLNAIIDECKEIESSPREVHKGVRKNESLVKILKLAAISLK